MKRQIYNFLCMKMEPDGLAGRSQNNLAIQTLRTSMLSSDGTLFNTLVKSLIFKSTKTINIQFYMETLVMDTILIP